MNAEKDTGGRHSPMIIVNGAKVCFQLLFVYTALEHIPKLNQH